MIVGVTGHRPEGFGFNYDWKGDEWLWLRQMYRGLFNSHATERVITGMALGVDTVVAGVCRDEGIPYVAAVPFEGQESRWPPTSQKLYHELLEAAEEVVIVSKGGYQPWKFHVRNQYIVDNSDLLIAGYTGIKTGGTASTIEKARKKNRPIIILDPLRKDVYFE